jgi:hypothetical protein
MIRKRLEPRVPFGGDQTQPLEGGNNANNINTLQAGESGENRPQTKGENITQGENIDQPRANPHPQSHPQSYMGQGQGQPFTQRPYEEKSAEAKKKIRCKKWPMCKMEGCEYSHPKETVRNYFEFFFN